MQSEQADPLIVTLALDGDAQRELDGLRQRHFPPERNLIPAHVTLFHALPGAHLDAIRATLLRECAALPPSTAVVGPSVLLGRGVALAVAVPSVVALRNRLRTQWRPWLTAQDAGGWRPHATVQNKVTPERARALHQALCASLPPFDARAEGLLLWHYRGGPWEPAGRFAFTA